MVDCYQNPTLENQGRREAGPALVREQRSVAVVLLSVWATKKVLTWAHAVTVWDALHHAQ